MSTIRVELAEELLAAAGIPQESPSNSAAQLIALELFRERRISLGKAAELSGLSIDGFMAFSAQREVPLHYTQEDWEADQAIAKELDL